MYDLCYDNLAIRYEPKDLFFEVNFIGETWKWKNDKTGIELCDGTFKRFDEFDCTSYTFLNGVEEGVKDEYSIDNTIIKTTVSIVKASKEVRFKILVTGDKYNSIHKVYWPSPFEFCPKEGEGYSVLPFMQGVLLPARWSKEVKQYADGIMFERDAYMPMFGQVKGDCGYIAIFETPYDANYNISHKPFGETLLRPAWRPSLGIMSYEREIIYIFLNNCDYNLMAKEYRKYSNSQGNLVTLKQKIAKNQNIAKLIGTPVVHTDIAVHIQPDTHYYDPDRPENNDHYVSFSTRADQLRILKNKGVENIYLHLDGWGKMGYDNLHPDVFPPYEKAGGAAGMKELSDTCSELGYIFGIHDQYHDYYYDAETFDISNAIVDTHGESEYVNYWYGGEQTLLCTKLAPDYIKRNFYIFKDYGIKIEGSYLDVFSVVALRECAHPDHTMTRKESAEYRRKCFEILNSEGIITSSEETTDFILSSMALCHHAPFAVEEIGSSESDAIGIPIPLFNLVYHDCIVTPWWGLNGSGWNIPKNDWGFLHALLNGGTIYYAIDENEEEIELGKKALELHKKVCLEEMVMHEFLDETYRKQKTVFSDGTSVIVDFDSKTWEIS